MSIEADRVGKSGRFEAVRIVLFAMLAAIAYGILHDLVTAHLCVEYFTVAHPPVFPTSSPFLLGLGWGIIATWWVGLLLGIALAAAARLGPRPRLGLAELRRPILLVMLASALAAFLTGIAGAFLASAGLAPLPTDLGFPIPAGRHVSFFAVSLAHAASYLAGAVGGLVVIVLTVRKRTRRPS
ncbi:MAG TPA: hypothetical protein VIT45_05325 [Allosphingosinicella sp.]